MPASIAATSLVSRVAPAKLLLHLSFVMPFVTVMRRTPLRVGSRETEKKEIA